MTDPIRLTAHERDTQAWQKVAHMLDERLKMHRAVVENPTEPEAKRLGAAWCIKELKEIARLAEPPKEKQPPEGFAD
jgi:hypothetical protein